MDWNTIITNALLLVISVIGGLVAYYVMPWIKQKIQNTWVEKAVRAAEKLYKQSGTGAQKKAYVIDFLVEMGIVKKDNNGNIPQNIDVLIEAAVKELDAIVATTIE